MSCRVVSPQEFFQTPVILVRVAYWDLLLLVLLDFVTIVIGSIGYNTQLNCNRDRMFKIEQKVNKYFLLVLE